MSLGSLMPIRDKGKTSKANEHIDTFQSLRFVAIMMIVLHHVNFMYQDGSSFLPGGGPAGVSFFVLLSGFVLTYAWRERPFAFPLSLRSHAVWLWSRIRKFYFLHLLTFCLAAPMTCYGLWKSQEWGLGIAETMANLLLVQSLVPVKDVYFSYNAVSWYLSDTMWFYLCLPACLYLFRKWHRSKMALLTGIFMLQIIYNWICLGSPYEHWLLYINPLYRLTDFLIGGCVCLMAMDNRGGADGHSMYVAGRGQSPYSGGSFCNLSVCAPWPDTATVLGAVHGVAALRICTAARHTFRFVVAAGAGASGQYQSRNIPASSGYPALRWLWGQ